MPALPDVEEVTKSVKAIPQLIEALTELIKMPFGIVVFVLILVWFIKTIGAFQLVDFLGRRSRARAEALEKYLANTAEKDTVCVAALHDVNDAEHFRLATKIYVEKLRRTALIALHARVQHKVTWVGIRQALQYYEYHLDGTVTIRAKSLFDRLGYYYNYFMAGFAGLGGIGLIALLLLTRRTEMQAIISLAGIPLALFIGIFSVYQNLPDYFAGRISAALAEQFQPPRAKSEVAHAANGEQNVREESSV
jgi:hypothetical protein